MTKPGFVPYSSYAELPLAEMQRRAAEFNTHVHRRRTVRQFDARPVPRGIIADCIHAAGSAPTGRSARIPPTIPSTTGST